MKFDYIKVSPDDEAFIALVDELNQTLKVITSDSGESSFKKEAFCDSTDGALLILLDQKPVACGVFRHHAPEVCEMKRMFSKQPGAGRFLITQLEKYAFSLGYRRAVLSTRRVNQSAVDFYIRQGYLEVEAYGKYRYTDQSICLGKLLCK